MKLEQKWIDLNRQNGSAVSQVTLEADLNVPDQKPDIYKILHGQGEFQPDEIKSEQGKVKIRGVFFYRILYIGEGRDRMPDFLEGSIPVDETVFLNELEEGDILDFHWKQEDLHVSEIHSRKANVKAVLTMEAEALREQPVPVLEETESCPDLLLKTCAAQLQQEVIHKKDTVRIREELNLPPGKPNIKRILWKEIRLQGTEIRQEDGRFRLRGELEVFLLYESENEEVRLQWLEQNIPFRNEMECEECRSELSGMTEICLRRAEAELQADYDGEPRTVRVDAVLELQMRYFEDCTCDVLCDAYSFAKEISPIRKEVVWDEMVQAADSRIRIAGKVKIADTDPEMMQLLCTGGEVHADYAALTNEGLKIQGTAEVWVLCAAAEDAQPLVCISEAYPFETVVELRDADPDSQWQLYAGMDQLNGNLTDTREIEIKGSVQIQILVRKRNILSLVEGLEEAPLDTERIRKLPGMAVHVVQPDETMWNIAKAHATTCQSVMDWNDLKEETVKPGMKLLLVKEPAEKTIVSASEMD